MIYVEGVSNKGTPYFYAKRRKGRKSMRNVTQKEQLDGMMRRPIPKKKVSIVHLSMVKEGRCL